MILYGGYAMGVVSAHRESSICCLMKLRYPCYAVAEFLFYFG